MTAIACVGLAVQDVIFTLGSLPTGPGKWHVDERHEVGGGPAANAAVAIAAIGGEARLVTALGDDRLGDSLVAELAELGVDTSRIRRRAGLSSPLSAVMVDERGERAIINHTPPELLGSAEPPVEDDLAGADAVLADIRWPLGAAAALRWARRNDVPGILDHDLGGRGADHLLDLASHVVLSAPSLQRLSGKTDPGEGLVELSGRTGSWLAVTIGEGGTLWLSDGTVQEVPAFQVDVVDTTGAGDVYHGVFAYEMGAHGDEMRAMTAASAAAALSCTRLGGREGVPTREQLDAFLEEMA